MIQYDNSDIELRTWRKIWRWVPSLYAADRQGKEFMVTVKWNEFGVKWSLAVIMETRHLVKGQFNREFPAICNH